VPCLLEIPDHVADYLDGDDVGLSDHARARVAAALEFIENLTDAWRADPDNRVPSPPGIYPMLRYGHVFAEADGRLCSITFVIDDRPAAQGVLRIPYAEYTAGKPILPPNP
jgi:hypothetical protein